MNRLLDDIVAECLWRLPGITFMRRPWEVEKEISPLTCEQKLIEARSLIRLLESMGVKLECAATDARSAPRTTSDTIWRYRLSTGTAERLVRRSGEGFEIVFIEGGEERVEHSFDIATAHIHAGMVLMGDPEAKKIANLGKELSAALEAYRVFAVSETVEKNNKEAAE